MRKNFTRLAGIFLGFIFLFTPLLSPVLAGGTTVKDISITTTVQLPQTTTFVENLGPTDSKYRPGQIITFHIAVRNTGTEALQSVTVQDALPAVNGQPVIDFMTGPGTYIAVKHMLMVPIDNLAVGESKSFELKGKIVHAALLPPDQTIICPQPGNMATAFVGTLTKKATSSFCVEKQGGAKQTPPTGPSSWILTYGLLLCSLGIGYVLRRKAHLSPHV